MNIQTDIEVTPESCAKSDWHTLCRIALEGDEDQRDTLLTWAWRGLPAVMWEELVALSDRAYLLD